MSADAVPASPAQGGALAKLMEQSKEDLVKLVARLTTKTKKLESELKERGSSDDGTPIKASSQAASAAIEAVAEISELKAQIAAAEQRAADAEASAQATSEELAKMKVEYKSLAGKTKLLMQKLAKSEEHSKDEHAEHAADSEQAAALTAALEAARNEVAELKLAAERAAVEHASIVDELKATLEQVRADAVQAASEIEQLEADKQQLSLSVNNDTDAQQVAIQNLQQHHADVLASMERQLKEFSDSKAAIEQEFKQKFEQELDAERGKLSLQQSEHETVVSELKSSVEGLQQELNVARQQHETFHSAQSDSVQSLQQRVQELEVELQSATEKHQAAVNSHASLADEHGNVVTQLQATVQTLTADLQFAKDSSAQLQQTLDRTQVESQKQQSQHRSEISDLEAQVKTLSQTKGDKKGKQAKQELQDAQKRFESTLTELKQEHASALTALQQQNQNLNRQAEQAKNEIANLQAELKQIHESTAAGSAELKQRESELLVQVQQLQDSLATSAELQNQFQSRIQSLESEISAHHDQISSLSATHEKAQSSMSVEMAALQTQLSLLEQQAHDSGAHVAQIVALQDQLRAAEESHQVTSDNHADSQKQVVELTEQTQKLQSQLEDMQQTLESTRTQHESELAAARVAAAESAAAAEASWTQRLNEVETTHQSRLSDLETSNQTRVTEMETSHQARIEALTNDLNQLRTAPVTPTHATSTAFATPSDLVSPAGLSNSEAWAEKEEVYKNKMRQLMAKVKQLTAQLQDAKKDGESLSSAAETDELKLRIATLESETAEHQARVETMQQQIDQTRSELDECVRQRDSATAELEQARQTVAELNERLASNTSTAAVTAPASVVEPVHSEVAPAAPAELNESTSQTPKSTTAAESFTSPAGDELTAMKAKCTRLAEAVTKYRTAIGQLQEKLAKQQAATEETQAQLEERTKELEAEQSRVAALQRVELSMINLDSELSRAAEQLSVSTAVDFPSTFHSMPLEGKLAHTLEQLRACANACSSLTAERVTHDAAVNKAADKAQEEKNKLQAADEKLAKFKAILVRANKALEDKKRDALQLSEQLQQQKESLSALKSDVNEHWCYVPPTPAAGGEAVAEFCVRARTEIDGTSWCLAQVTEHVDTEVLTMEADNSSATAAESNADDGKTEENKTEDSKPADSADGAEVENKDSAAAAPSAAGKIERVTSVRVFWVPESIYLNRLQLPPAAARAAMPDAIETTVEKRLKEKFDRAWASNQAECERVVAESAERAAQATAAAESTANELKAYKERAHKVLTEQQERLQQFPALTAAAAEAASARDALRVAEERWAQQGAPALEELDALRARHLETDREIESLRAAAALAETRARQRAREDEQKHQKAIEDLQSLHQQEMQEKEAAFEKVKEEAAAARTKARTLLQQRETQIASLQAKLRSGDVEPAVMESKPVVAVVSTAGAAAPVAQAAVQPTRENTVVALTAYQAAPAPAAPRVVKSSPFDAAALLESVVSGGNEDESAELFGRGKFALNLPVHLQEASSDRSSPVQTPSAASTPRRPSQSPSGGPRGLAITRRPSVDGSDIASDAGQASEEVQEAEFVHLAALQAQRDDELHRHRQHIRRLQQLLREQEASCAQLNAAQEDSRNRIKELERGSKRSGANLEYLKNMIIRWMEEDQQDQLFSVIATILQFSPEETQRLIAKRKSKSVFGLW